MDCNGLTSFEKPGWHSPRPLSVSSPESKFPHTGLGSSIQRLGAVRVDKGWAPVHRSCVSEHTVALHSLSFLALDLLALSKSLNVRQEEKGMTEDEMAGWHHRLNGHEYEQAPEVGDGQGGLVCCSPWGHRESDTTERLN